MRVDPTDMIAPDRLGSDLASYLQAHPADPAARREDFLHDAGLEGPYQSGAPGVG